ncbi:hypothetical protein CapIbe_010994 [Capra ibex]
MQRGIKAADEVKVDNQTPVSTRFLLGSTSLPVEAKVPACAFSTSGLTVMLQEERNITFERLLDTIFELKLILGDTKHHCVHHLQRSLWRNEDCNR